MYLLKCNKTPDTWCCISNAIYYNAVQDPGTTSVASERPGPPHIAFREEVFVEMFLRDVYLVHNWGGGGGGGIGSKGVLSLKLRPPYSQEKGL